MTGGVYMAFFNDNIPIITDSMKNIHMFQWNSGNIYSYYFNLANKQTDRRIIAENTLEEFDVTVDSEDNIYLVYQDQSFNLILLELKENRIKRTVITEEPLPVMYNLNIMMGGENIHIIYEVPLHDIENIYRICHQYKKEDKWITNIVDDIKVKKILNPIQLIKNKDTIMIGYYDLFNTEEEVCVKSFSLKEGKWDRKIQLTKDQKPKLYIDMIVLNEKIHLVYSEYYEGNLKIRYERFSLSENIANMEVREDISNIENCSHPTLVYFEDKLWVEWIEYDNITSRFSADEGDTWGSIYQWKESKGKEVVRYKYKRYFNTDRHILNFSFGKIYPEISFIGFGNLQNTAEIPLKKNLHSWILPF